MLSIFLILLIVAVGLFVVQNRNTSEDSNNTKCGEKLEERRLKLGDLETKHVKCRLDIENLQRGIDKPPPPNMTFGTFYGDVEDNCSKRKDLNKRIEQMKRAMEDCGKLKKHKIKELRDVIEKNTEKISNAEFNEILKQFNIS